MKMRSLSTGRESAAFGRNISVSGGAKYYFNIISITPSNVNAGVGNTVVQILATGKNPFNGNSTPYINGVVAATYILVNPFRIDVTIPAAVIAVPGFVSIRIRDSSAPALRYSNNVFFAVNYPVPTLTSATFDGVNAIATGTNYFVEGTYAVIDGIYTLPFVWVSSTSGTVVVPQAAIDIPGLHQLRIVNPAPGGGQSAQQPFPVKFLAPRIISITPNKQFVGRDSGTITLVGDPDTVTYAFYTSSVVRVDGTIVPFVLVDETHITFSISPALMTTPGVKAITVSNPTGGGGGGVSNASFTSFAPSLITLDITDVPQFFDGFDVSSLLDEVDSNFVITYNNVAQPTTFISAQIMVAHVTSAAIAVPGTTMVRARDTISGLSTNAIAFTVVPWDPLRLGTTLRMWLDGTSLVNDGGGRASSWQDKSGGARHCAPVTPANKALIVTSAPLNNMPAARFVASPLANYSYTPWLVAGAAGLVNEDKYTIWVVAVTTSLGFQQTVLGDFFGYIKVCGTSNGPPVSLDGLDSSGGSVTARSPFAWYPGVTGFAFRQRKLGNFFAVRAARNADVIVATAGSNPAFDPSIFYVASGAATGGAWVGDIAEVIVCDTDVNSTHKAIMDNRLSYLYGLPFGTGIGKPVITSLNPAVCTQYDLPFWLYVNDTGGGYTPTSVINLFDTPLATEFISTTQIRARVPNAFLATSRGLAVTVADTGGISAPTGLAILPYADVPGIPNLHTANPNTSIQFGAALPIRVTGTGFTAASVIRANGVPLTTTLDTGDLLATLPVTALDVLPGPLITVTDPSGTSPNSLEITLTPWSPMSLPSVTGWYAADDVLVAGGKITQFNDKTGNGRHYVQADTTKQGLYNASDPAFNGKPSVQLDGIDDAYPAPAGFNPIPAGNSVFASVYRYLVVDGAGIPTQPFVNDVMVAVPSYGIAAHLVPLTLIGYANDGGAYRNVTNAALVVGATQRCQFRITALSMVLEIGATASTPFVLSAFAPGAGMTIGYINFGTNNAMNGKLAVWVTTGAAWSAQDSICWGNFCRYNYGTP